jgi:DNA polymerase III subunit epsilon
MNIETAIETLQATGEYRVVRKHEPHVTRTLGRTPNTKLAAFLDCETTGLFSTDKIVELAIVPFEFSSDGQIQNVYEGIALLEDPGIPIPPEATLIHGLTDEKVAGQKIDDDLVAETLQDVVLIIAHNAAFDRGMFERRFPQLRNFFWACSMKDIPWLEEGLPSKMLELIAYRYGIFYDMHRALSDCHAAIHILSQDLPISNRSVMGCLLETSKKRLVRIWAIESPKSLKDRLKRRGYHWEPETSPYYAWFVDVLEENVEAEKRFLCEEILGRDMDFPTKPIPFRRRYSGSI